MENLAQTMIHLRQEETRGQRLWRVLRERRDTEPISLERARLITESYKETEGQATVIRRAKAFEKIVTEIPIFIDDDQLLAGDYASRPMAAEWFPEFTVEWIIEELKDGQFPYLISEKDKSLLKEVADYWKDRAAKEAFLKQLREEELTRTRNVGEPGAYVYAPFQELQTAKGWNVPDYPRAINRGLLGILADVEEELSNTKPLDEASLYKTFFLEALVIELKAAIRYAKRYADLARHMAKQAEGKRTQELERIAEICEWVPENPARSFHEAMQTMLFCHLLIYWDAWTFGVSLGRVDQYLYPYYKHDITEGNINKEEVIQILECFRVKMCELRQFNTSYVRDTSSGETQFQNCTLGGQMADGEDATNELSFLWLEAAMRTQTPHPTLSVRWHKKLSPEFAMKAAELCRVGLGFPAWFGDKASVKYLIEKGSSLEEARDYALAGCVLHVIPGKTPPTWPSIMNMAKIFEIMLNNGIDPRTGKEVGLNTGNFDDIETFEELFQAYIKQANFFFTEANLWLNKIRLWRSERIPQLFSSCFFDDCIKRGKNVVGGGARYQHSAMYLLPIGLVDVADSMAAIKKYVYDEGKTDKQELMNALRVNFKGYENLRQLLLSAPKYGNDDDYVDKIVADLYEWVTMVLSEHDAPFGAKFVNAPHNLSIQGKTGNLVGALPSGRSAGLALCDGAVSAAQGMDVKGPTALINSAGKIDHIPVFGTLFNVKFHPSALKTREDIEKFLLLIETYFDNYEGKHIQFNVVSRDTLIDAKAHPERYRNLVVRVAGYSALWVELNETIQNEIIARTEHSFYQ